MTVSREAEKLMGDLKSAVQDGSDLLRTTAKELNVRTRDCVNGTIATAKEIGGRTGAKCRVLAERTDRTVRDHPYAAIGVGLGLGIVLGALLLRR